MASLDSIEYHIQLEYCDPRMGCTSPLELKLICPLGRGFVSGAVETSALDHFILIETYLSDNIKYIL